MAQRIKLFVALVILGTAGFVFWYGTLRSQLEAPPAAPSRPVTKVATGRPRIVRDSRMMKAELQAAVEQGDAAKVRELVEAGARWSRGSKEWPHLAVAAGEGHLEIVRALLEAEAAVDEAGPGGWTALMIAGAENQVDVMRCLLEAGADPLLENQLRQTVYDIAVLRGAEASVALLREPALARRDGRALILAAYQGRYDEVKRLLDEGADVNAMNMTHGTALTYVFGASEPPGVHFETKAYNPAVAQLLLDRGADPNHVNKQGRTPLMHAIHAGDTTDDAVHAVSLMLEYGALVDRKNQRGETALSLALQLSDADRRERLAALLKAPADTR